MCINYADINTFTGDSPKIRKKYIIPSVNKDERIGDFCLMRLMFKAVGLQMDAASWNGLQSRSNVRANGIAEIKYQERMPWRKKRNTIYHYYKGAAPLNKSKGVRNG